MNVIWLLRKVGLFMSLVLAGMLANPIASAQGNSSVAQEAGSFRIETDVMVADSVEPVIQMVTLFHGGVAYDYSRSEPDRVTIIHPAENRIVFLDQYRELQARVSLQDLKGFMERARVELASSSLKAALQDAEFIHVDQQAQRVTLGQRFVRYEAAFQQCPRAEFSVLYADFANASAYINSWQAPDRHPPSFARVRFNQILADQQAVPTEITRTTFINEGREHVLRSRLHATWQLSNEDLRAIEKFHTMANVFPSEDVAEFMSPTKTSTGKAGGTGKTGGTGRTIQR